MAARRTTPKEHFGMTPLTDQERRALNEFVSREYGDFRECALLFLDEEEIQDLENKLSKE